MIVDRYGALRKSGGKLERSFCIWLWFVEKYHEGIGLFFEKKTHSRSKRIILGIGLVWGHFRVCLENPGN